MRKNRKMSKKMSVTVGRTVQIGAVMVMAFAMVIVYMLANSSCKHLENRIEEKKNLIKALEDEKERESGYLAAMTTPSKLDEALLKHGLSMHSPKPSIQVVRLNSKGQLYPAQLSVAKAKERNRTSDVAQYIAPRPRVDPALSAVAKPRPAAQPRQAASQSRPAAASARPAAAKPRQAVAQARQAKPAAPAKRTAAVSRPAVTRSSTPRPASRAPARSTASKSARR
jgi:hypothetical protein